METEINKERDSIANQRLSRSDVNVVVTVIPEKAGISFHKKDSLLDSPRLFSKE